MKGPDGATLVMNVTKGAMRATTLVGFGGGVACGGGRGGAGVGIDHDDNIHI